jgi:hypothetical protein
VNEWALLKGGRIVNVIMTSSGKKHMQEHYPEHEVADINSLPTHVREAYQYWRERP